MNFTLKISGQAVPLPAGVSLTLTRSGGPMLKETTGTWSYPFTLPVCPETEQIFGGARRIERGTDRRKTFPAQLWQGSFLLEEGSIRLLKAGWGGYQVNFVCYPGGLSREFWETPLPEMDLGSHALTVTQEQTRVFAVLDAALSVAGGIRFGDVFAAEDSNVRLFVGGQKWVDFTFSRPNDTTGLDWLEGKKGEMIEQFQSAHAGYTLAAYPGSLTVIFPQNVAPGAVYCEIRKPFSSFEVRRFDLVRLSCPKVTGSWETSLFGAGFALPPMRAMEGFTPEQAPDWEGRVNHHNGFTFAQNTETGRTTGVTMPCLRLRFLIETLLESVGYAATGDALTHESFATAILVSGRYVERQHPGTTLPWLVSPAVLKYADLCPRWTVRELFDALRLPPYGLNIEWNSFARTCQFSFQKSALSGPVVDVSGRVSVDPVVEVTDETRIQLAYASEAEGRDVFKPFPTDEAVKASGKNYTRWESKFSFPWVDWEVTPVAIPGFPLQPPANALFNDFLLNVTNLAVSSGGFRGYPRIEGQLPDPTDKEADFTPLLLLWGGLQDGKVVSDYKTPNFSFEMGAALGPVEKFYREVIAFWESAVKFETTLRLTLPELAAFSFSVRLYAYGMVCVVERMEARLPHAGSVKLTGYRG